MVKSILFIVAVGVVGVLLLAARKPDEFAIARSAQMAATPAAIFAEINDLHRWSKWSPWQKLDPSAKIAFGGSPLGEGAWMSWEGNRHVGSGTETIIQSVPGERIQLRLDFTKPMKATNMAEFLLEPEGRGTRVTWSMSGKNNFLSKIMCVFMNMDKMVGKQFEKGLSSIKTIVENQPSK